MDISSWKGRIARCEAVQSKMHTEWKQAIALYNCQYKDRSEAVDDERVEVNFVNWYVTNLVPLTYFRDPTIFIKSKTDSYDRFADTLDKVVNSEWKRLRLKDQFKDVILSALLMPPGWMKLGYTAKIGKDEAKHEEDKEKGIIQSLKEAITGLVKKEQEEKLPEEQGILNPNIKEESIFATWIPSWNILIPPGYHRFEDLPYIIQYEKMALIDFLENPMYKNKDDLKGVYEANDSQNGKLLRNVPYGEAGAIPDNNNDEMSTIKVFHIWDRRSQKRMSITLQCEKSHFEGDWPYDMEGLPYKYCMFEKTLPTMDDPNPYPANCIRPILPQVEEQSNIRTQMSRWRKRSAAIILAQRDMLSETDMNQLENTEALQICYVSNIQGVQMTNTPALPPQIFEVGSEIQQDLQSATNMGQLMFAPQPGQRTAGQAKIGQQGLQLKISAKQDVIEDLTVDVARGLAQLAWQFYDRDKVKEIIGEEVSEQMWPDLPDDRMERRRIIQGMKVFIDAGSAAPPKDETTDRKQLLDWLNFAGTIAPERLKKDEVLKAGMKRWKFVKDVDKMVITNDDEEIKAADEENGLMESNIPCIVSPNNNHQLHLQEHMKAKKGPAVAQHILDHAKFAGLLPGGKKGSPGSEAGGKQKGDNRMPQKSLNPELTRQKAPTEGGIDGSAQNRGAGAAGGV